MARDGTNRGRPKGSRNRKTVEKVAAVEASGLTPLDYLLSVMRDEKVPRAERIDVATQVAPYVHAKLAPVDKNGDVQGTVVQVIFQGSDVRG